jgi:CubicO group peptidase (beta-lactamase class C family)
MSLSRRALILTAALVSAASLAAQDRFAAVPAAVQPFVDRQEISGAVMLVADGDHILHLSAVGTNDVATHRPMRTDDLFWIASMSKPITSAAVGILVDEGKLAWTDPVEKYLPEFHGQWVIAESAPGRRVLVPAAHPITIAELLTHTSGLGEYAVTDPHWSLAEFVKVVAREPLRFQPGSRWGYSTAGLDTAGRIVEVVSGQPFADFMQRRIFDPLGMSHTTFWVADADLPRYARSYVRDAAAGKLVETTIHYMYGGAVTDRARPALGGAGLFSTAEDLLRFYRMMLHGGELNGARLLSAKTVAEMTTPHTGSLAARPGMPWGYGFCVIADPSKMDANVGLSPGTFGHGGAFGTQSWADPATGRITIFMIQRDKMGNPDNSPMRRAFQTAVAAALAR